MRNLFQRLSAAAIAAAVLGVFAAAPAAQAQTCKPTAALTRIPLPGKPFGVDASADGCWLFVALARTPESEPGIAVLRQTGGGLELARTIKAPDAPAGVAMSHDGKVLAVAANRSVLLYDVAKLEARDGDPLIARIPFDDEVGAVEAAITGDDRILFTTLERRNAVAIIDLAKARTNPSGAGLVMGEIPTGRTPVGLALSADNARLYVTSEHARSTQNLPPNCYDAGAHIRSGPHGVLQAVDVAKALADPKAASLGVMIAGCSPVRIAVSPDGHTAWVTARGDDTLLAFDLSGLGGSGPVGTFRSVKVGTAPVGLAVRPDGAQVWVANSDRFENSPKGSLSVLWLGGDALVQELPAAGFPRELKFLPDGTTLAVTEFSGRSLALIDTSKLKR